MAGTDLQRATRERNWRIFRLRALWYAVSLLSDRRAQIAKELVDDDLNDLGAESESGRRAATNARLIADDPTDVAYTPAQRAAVRTWFETPQIPMEFRFTPEKFDCKDCGAPEGNAHRFGCAQLNPEPELPFNEGAN